MAKSLSISHIHWGFPPIIGGVETHLTLLLPEFVKRKNKVSLLTSSSPKQKNRHDYKGVDVFRDPLMDLNWLLDRGLDSLEEDLEKMYKKFIDKSKPDIIHTHNMHYFSKVHTKTLEEIAFQKGIPLVLTAHNVWDDILFLKLTRDIKWDHIIAVSHYIKKELMGIGIDEEKITVVHHGIDTEMFNPDVKYDDALLKYPKMQNKKVVFHPARIGMAKGCDVSIKAINLVRKHFPDVMLVLAGTQNIIDWSATQQKDIAYFLNLIKSFNLEENIYVDSYALEEMPSLYALSQVALYPSSASEPFGLTMLESLASATPMIVTNMGGMPEIIENDINGYVVKVRDYEELADRIIRLLGDECLSNRLGRTGRQNVTTYYTKEIMTDAHVELYKNILANKLEPAMVK